MTKRGKIRLGTLAAAVALTLCGLWLDTAGTLRESEAELEYAYRRALNDLADSVSGMESALRKAPYVSTASMQTAISAALLEQSGGAKAALSALPLSQEKTDKISRFLSQTGDYALSLSRRCASGGSLNESDCENLAVLREYAGILSESLQNAQARLDTEGASIGRVESALSNVGAPDDPPALDGDFDQAAEAFARFPSLLYDGPFSDRVDQKKPLYLEGREEITENEAARRAADFLRCSPADLTLQGEFGETIKVYSFTDGSSHVNITKRGGEVAYFKKAGEIAASNLTHEEALIRAEETLGRLGVEDFTESGHVLNDNMCTISFAAVARLPDGTETVCYPDLVKVVIELNEGGTVEVDAAGYLMNHRERILSSPALTKEEAGNNLSPLLTVESASPALIPTPGQDEVLCWEFSCRAPDGQKLLAYIDAETGQEEQLYLLHEDEHGVLVM